MRYLAVVFSFLFLSSCAAPKVTMVTEIVRVYITTTPENTGTATTAPSHTPTPTATATPTPTALPASISGYPRGYQQLDPTPSYGALCGLVDTFDFPLDPPHGEDASSRYGFGNFSNRYGKYHAGEDWGIRNESNLGKPVHSIGHGQVTYAAPNGWGLDKGTIVIRHVFPWGGYVLSFYGHLDPPSVKIKTGDCVRRGEKIAEIGDPRTSPHLHFEIRLHLPNSTGHGYWSVNPRLAGWLHPSQTIWETRMKASPGVLWLRSFVEGLTLGLGRYEDEYILIQGGELTALVPQEGTVNWSQPISKTVRNAALDQVFPQVYQLDMGGDVTAYTLPGPIKSSWKAHTNAYSSAELIPFPDGGILVADRRRAIAVDPSGNILWAEDASANPTSWVHFEDKLVFSTSSRENPIRSADDNGIETWDINLGGKLHMTSDGIYLYADDGIYLLDINSHTAEQVAALPVSILELRELISLQDGGLLIAHADIYDRRLLALNQDGSLKWEFSVLGIPHGSWQFISQGRDIYLFIIHSDSTGTEGDLYFVDQVTGSLTHILNGGTRMSYTRDVWLVPMGEGLYLLNVGNGPLLGIDPQTALDVISTP